MKLIFEKSTPGQIGDILPANPLISQYAPPAEALRANAPRLPEVAEVAVVRHYMALSRMAFGVDNGFYPLGSCTMKYNPKAAERAASDPHFTDTHPLQPQDSAQGCIEVMYRLQEALNEISGMGATSLMPAAGAQGEWTGINIVRAYHAHNHDEKRTRVLTPDSAHGTNPATAAMCGYEVINIPSGPDGLVDADALARAADGTTAALMLTNPNTLGKFEKNICRIAEIVHNAGGLLYYDGANMNAVMGVTRPGDMGFDIMHWNLHKTLATPHGGGGPGSGPVGVRQSLARFLPAPVAAYADGAYTLSGSGGVGRAKMFYGNFLVLVKALYYVLALGGDGLREASVRAVLNANYLLRSLEQYSSLRYDSPCMHEFVLTLETLKEQTGVSALDVAKTMIDYGVHPPTMYFPLTVGEALMFEPTETESQQTLNDMAEIMDQIVHTAKDDPELLHTSPYTTPVCRPDEVRAAREPKLRY
jgi:glycine dehydrogenase subunit 2